MATPLKPIQFVGTFEQIYEGAAAGRVSRWLTDVLDDKMLFATPSAPALYWPGSGSAREIPGLPAGTGWDGVVVVGKRVVLWKGQTVKSSVTGDFAGWIPVGITAADGRGKTREQYTQPDIGAFTDWVFLEEVSGTFVPEQFVRVVSNEDDPSKIRYDYYTVSEFATKATTETTAIGRDAFIEPGETEVVFTNSDRRWPVGARVVVENDLTDLVVDEGSRENPNEAFATGILILNTGETLPNPGEEVSLSLYEYPSGIREGDYISASTSQSTIGEEIFEVVTVGQVLRARRVGAGSNQGPVGTQIAGRWMVWQPWVSVTNTSSVDINFAQGTDIYASDSIKLINQSLAGATSIYDTIPSGSVIETINANDASEFQNTGSDINGDILSIIPLAEYAYILKERSIQSMQPVDPNAGTWVVRAEILGEGPIGRYASVRINDQTIVFWGHSEFYSYSGGKTIVPLVTDSTSLAFNELDLARADEIVAFHYSNAQEVRFYYPTLTGAVRSLVFNYHYNTAVYDELSSNFEAVTAAGELSWELAPLWEDLDVSELWTGTPKRWYEYVDEGKRNYPLIGIDGDVANEENGEDTTKSQARLLLSDRVYYRTSDQDCSPQGYEALCETPDFDWGDAFRWKYADTVLLSLQVEDATLRALHPLKIRVQLGSRQSLDDDVEWSDPVDVEISGNLGPPARASVRAAGRYIRARFSSDQPGARWRIAEYTIVARMGGTF
jgi:hypothetical protein